MKKITKLITTAVLTLSLLLGGATVTQSNDIDVVMDYTIIEEFVADWDRSEKFVVDEFYNPQTGMTTRSLSDHENTTPHDNYEWTWIDHYMHWDYAAPDFGLAYVHFVAKDYQEFVSVDSRGFVVMRVIDYDMDGHADYADRRFYLVMQGELIMMPHYPEGFINLDFYKPTQEEADEFLKREMTYWVKKAGQEA